MQDHNNRPQTTDQLRKQLFGAEANSVNGTQLKPAQPVTVDHATNDLPEVKPDSGLITCETSDIQKSNTVNINETSETTITSVENKEIICTANLNDVSNSGVAPIANIDHAKPLSPNSFPNSKLLRNGDHSTSTTIPNIKHMLESYGIVVRYDVIRKRMDIQIPGLSASPENYLDVAMNQIFSLAALNDLGSGNLAPFVSAIADRNRFNPVATHIASKTWDGIDRLTKLYATLTVANDFPSHLRDVLIYRWLLSGVAAAFMPSGFRCRGVLTLQGPQSIGKTSWLRSLISDPVLREQVLKTDHHLDAGNKDSLISAISHFIVELGELDSTFKKDVARLKGFITADTDKVRRPYARCDSEYPRRTIFCASVNSEQFLVDDSGNSRWWTIPVTHIRFLHEIDMQQVFAQLLVDFHKPDARWWLDDDEERQLTLLNKRHQAANVVRDLLESGMDHDLPRDQWTFMSSIEVLRRLGLKYPSNRQCKEATAILTELYGPRKKIRGKDGWMVPLKSEAFTQVAVRSDDDLY